MAIQQQQQRNPPLIKSRTHVGSSAELSPSHCSLLTTGPPTAVSGPAPPNITVIPDKSNDQDQETRMKRGARFEKHDNRRYHTAGTIEDLRVCNHFHTMPNKCSTYVHQRENFVFILET